MAAATIVPWGDREGKFAESDREVSGATRVIGSALAGAGMEEQTSRKTPMKWAAAAALLYAMATGAAAATGYWQTGSVVALVLGGVAGLALLFCARRIAQGKKAAGFVAGGIAMLLGLYFGYGFIATGSFLPGGAMLLTSFAALFVILIGVFVQLAGES